MWVLLLGVVILGFLTAIFGYFNHLRIKKKLERGEVIVEPEPIQLEEEECCGEHATCEKDSLLTAVSKEIEYYDDEELDTWKHIPGDQHTPEAIEEFRNVFYTLKEDEVAGWVRSLLLREIELPDEIKDEVLLIVRERRIHP
ncbi:MAG: phospholipase [Bacteroidales bacterium]